MNLNTILDLEEFSAEAERSLTQSSIFLWKLRKSLEEVRSTSKDKLLLDTYKESYEELYHSIKKTEQDLISLTANLFRDWRVNKRMQDV